MGQKAAAHDNVRNWQCVVERDQARKRADVKKFTKLRKSNPALHAYAKRALLLERTDLLHTLKRLAPCEERDEIMRELWVVDGVLDQGLDSDLLESLLEKYRTEGTIPRGYSYDILFYQWVDLNQA